jgi:hypothetical protein
MVNFVGGCGESKILQNVKKFTNMLSEGTKALPFLQMLLLLP